MKPYTNDLNRWTELKLKNQITMRNRIVVPPMASQTADQDGFVTERTLAHYARLGQAQPGLLIVEYTFVHPTGRSEDCQLGIQSDAHIIGVSQLARVIKNSGALAGIQITHGGGKSDRSLTGGVLMGASAIAVPVKDRQLETPVPMDDAAIEMWKHAFIQASDRAVQAGFELLELHSAHGYGLNQWLSPLTNHRSDAYGGNLLKRMRLLCEIVEAVRARHQHILLSVRLPGQDFIEGGLDLQDSQQLARELEMRGVDILHISSGIGGWRRPPDRVGEGYLVAEAAQIQAVVKIPVIGVGGIVNGVYIDTGLRAGHFGLAAVGRAILADPQVWKEKQMMCQLANVSSGI